MIARAAWLQENAARSNQMADACAPGREEGNK